MYQHRKITAFPCESLKHQICLVFTAFAILIMGTSGVGAQEQRPLQPQPIPNQFGNGFGAGGGYRESSGAASGCYSRSPLGACVSALPVCAQAVAYLE